MFVEFSDASNITEIGAGAFNETGLEYVVLLSGMTVIEND